MNKPKLVPSQIATPEKFLCELVEIFTEPSTPPDDRDAAQELDMLFTLDPTAARDLTRALFDDQRPDVATPAGVQLMLDILQSVGAVEQKSDLGLDAMVGLKFNAQPLINILKRMPHRDPGMGLSRELVKDCTVAELYIIEASDGVTARDIELVLRHSHQTLGQGLFYPAPKQANPSDAQLASVDDIATEKK